ncbi:hypothetical protein F5Y12DRAFT_717023 [Xylaria sp. FL1777]|nr:hypothetical protein F5Y12DRAFT_717023 [Xylaria sp. FL1777]
MRYLAVVARPLVVCALSILPLVGASSILTFSDRNCSTLSGTIKVQDSTGSGECTKVTSGYASFMIGTLGDGCTVTVYGVDPKEPFCSSTNNELAETSVCYNTTWTQFSVDVCSPVASTSDLTSTLMSATSTSMTTPTRTSEPTSNNLNVGAVIGGTISGVFVVAAVVGSGLYFFWFRPKHQKQMAELPAQSEASPTGNKDAYAMNDIPVKVNPYTELPDEPQVYELSPQYIAEVHEETHHVREQSYHDCIFGFNELSIIGYLKAISYSNLYVFAEGRSLAATRNENILIPEDTFQEAKVLESRRA